MLRKGDMSKLKLPKRYNLFTIVIVGAHIRAHGIPITFSTGNLYQIITKA